MVIGDRVLSGRSHDATAAFREGMAISERLARQDPNNAAWQRDVMVSMTKLADVAAAAGQQAEAIAQAERAVALARTLVTLFPDNPPHARDLPVVEEMLKYIRDAIA